MRRLIEYSLFVKIYRNQIKKINGSYQFKYLLVGVKLRFFPLKATTFQKQI